MLIRTMNGTLTHNGCKYKQLLVKLNQKKKININQQHLFGSNKIIAYICCYKTFYYE